MAVNSRCSSRVPRDQVEVAARAVGQRLPGRADQQLAVDDRRDGDPAVGGQPPAVGPLGHRRADRVTTGGKTLRGNAGQVGHGGANAAARHRRRRCPRRGLGGEEGAGHALHDGPAEESRRTRHREQRRHRPPTGGLAEHGDPRRVPAEAFDAVAHPLQRRDLVEQPPVGRRSLDLAEPLEAHPVVEGHDHDPSVACEPSAVVLGQARHADLVAAALDPHHDRQAAHRARGSVTTRSPSASRHPSWPATARPCRSVRPAAVGARRPPPRAHRSRAEPAGGRRGGAHRPAARRTGCRGRRPRRPPAPHGRCRSRSGPPDGRRAWRGGAGHLFVLSSTEGMDAPLRPADHPPARARRASELPGGVATAARARPVLDSAGPADASWARPVAAAGQKGEPRCPPRSGSSPWA